MSYDLIYIPTLSEYEYSADSEHCLYPKYDEYLIITNWKKEEVMKASEFLISTYKKNTYSDYFFHDCFDLFRTTLLDPNSFLAHDLTKFYTFKKENLFILESVIYFLCSNGGREIRDAINIKNERDFYYNKFCALNIREIGVYANKRLMEHLSHKEAYTVDELETVEGIFHWLDRTQGKEYLRLVRQIEAVHRNNNGLNSFLYRLKNQLSTVDFNSYDSYPQILEIKKELDAYVKTH